MPFPAYHHPFGLSCPWRYAPSATHETRQSVSYELVEAPRPGPSASSEQASTELQPERSGKNQIAAYIEGLILKNAVGAAKWLYVLVGQQLFEAGQSTHLVTLETAVERARQCRDRRARQGANRSDSRSYREDLLAPHGAASTVLASA